MRNTITKLLAGLCLMLLAVSGFAVSGTWTNDANGSWNIAANWSGSTIATGADFRATFTNITANRIVNLSNNWTIGHITAADITHDFSITNKTLTLDVTSGPPLINVYPGRTLTISNVLAGADGMTKINTGTLTLFGVNTYTGPTTISNGTLTISGSGQLGSGTYSNYITNAAAFNYASSANQTLSGIISGTGTLTKAGASTLTLSGGSTNDIIVDGGVLLAAEWSCIRSSITINTNGTLQQGATGAILDSTNCVITLNGGTWDMGAYMELSPPAIVMHNGTITGTPVEYLLAYEGFVCSGTNTINNIYLSVQPDYTNSGLFNVSDGTTTVNGIIYNEGYGSVITQGITKAGAGTLVLSGTNIYIGPTIVSNGTLTISGSGQLGSGTYAAQITNNAAFNYASSADQNLSGIISGTGMLVKDGSGTLTLSGAGNNSYSGVTIVNSGVLLLNKLSGSYDALQSVGIVVNDGAILRHGTDNQISSSFVTNFTINSGGTWDMGEFYETMIICSLYGGTVTGTSAGFLYCSSGYVGGDTNVISQRISVRSVGANSGLFNIIDGITTINASIYSDNGTAQGITKTNSGTLRIYGTNNYTGRTTVRGGNLLCMSGGHSTNSIVVVTEDATNSVQVTTTGGRWSCRGLTNTASGIVFDFNVTPSTTVAPLYVNGNVVISSATKFSIIATNASIPVGTYPLISFTGSCTGAPSSTAYSLPVGMVATISTNAGVIKLNVTDVVTNFYATNVTWKSATLIGGVVNATQTVERVKLYWGPVDKGTNRTWAFTNNVGLVTNPSSLSITSSVSSLLATSTYYYTFTASNNVLGEIWGSPSKSFVTRPLGYLGSFSQLSWSNVNATTRLGVWTYPAQY